MDKDERPKERKLKGQEAIDAMPKNPQGVKLVFKNKSKKDKLKKLLGSNLKGVSINRNEISIFVDVDDLSQSDKDKIQRIVDGE